MKKFKTVATSVVAMAVLASSFAGCSLVKKLDTDAVIDATEDLCGYITSANYKKLSGMVSEDVDEDDLANIEDYCNMTSGDNGAFVNAFLDSASFEVDEESIEQDKKGEINVTVTFTVADVDAVKDNAPYASLDDATVAIADADTTEVEVDFALVEDDGEYLLTEVDAVEDFYASFCNDVNSIEIAAPAASVDDLVYDSFWWFTTSDGVYEDTDEIDLEIYVNDEAYMFEITWECYYNGSQLIATGDDIDAWIDYSDVEGLDLEDGYYFPSGEYTITFYADGEEIFSDTCTVIYTGEAGDPSGDPSSIEVEYNFDSAALQAAADTYVAAGCLVLPIDDQDDLDEISANEGFMALDENLQPMAICFSSDDAAASLQALIDTTDATNVSESNGVTTFEAEGISYAAIVSADVVVITIVG